ncbi:T-box transcription factor TBX6 [Drosophila pseudoobscura]|uniref:T-box transcription factor TBX6 n=1 Tax=Drosophila pseudoobscura pseudoobscura TaxID=46245 RepID=Q29F62_DROPS|nr:T-box transcription factor TBX6 [Drosophila pseudoobscura]
MLALPNIADLRMQQQIAHEIYRHQIMQRLPDPLCGLLPAFAGHFVPPPPPPQQPSLPGVEAKLENNELWQQFHNIGTEMIITKCGRRMFPSMRVSLSGLEEEASYCVLLEMVPIGDCRYKFSGSQWVPAGGAEPQSPQRMYLHPESPATGKHWQSQALLFSKVKLTNNTLDNNGHIVLASMHKYQPRLHVIRTSDLGQIPWAPQQAFVFPETEFIAVTAYQNDRITKLKIDNNPFAKGFRESGQSRCKRKLNDSPPPQPAATAGGTNVEHSPLAKRLRLVDDLSLHPQQNAAQLQSDLMQRHYLLDTLEGNFYLPAPPPPQLTSHAIEYARHIACYPSWAYTPPSPASSSSTSSSSFSGESAAEADADTFVDVVGTNTTTTTTTGTHESAASVAADADANADAQPKPKRSSFSISDILGTSVSV